MGGNCSKNKATGGDTGKCHAGFLLAAGAAVGIWAVFGSGMIEGGWWGIAAAAVGMFCCVLLRRRVHGAVFYFFAGIVGGFWFFNLAQSGGNFWFFVSPPSLQQSMLVVFSLLFFAGMASLPLHGGVGRLLLVLAIPAGIAAGTGTAFKPKSPMLEQGDVFGENSGILGFKRGFFAAKDEHGDTFAIAPGAAGTPWVTWFAGKGREIVCPNGLRIVGVFGGESRFLPCEHNGEKLPFWTYLGGMRGAGVAPMSAVRTDILNYGKL